MAFSLVRIFPSGSTIFRTTPTGALAFDGETVIVIWSPGFMIFRFQPSRDKTPGLFVSPAQCTTLPCSSFASKYTWQCGFDQTNSVTVAVIVTCLVKSYEAFVP